jgi:hypothetical protein
MKKSSELYHSSNIQARQRILKTFLQGKPATLVPTILNS